VALQIKQGHLQGRLGKAVGKGAPVHAPAQPFDVERIGPEKQGSQHLADQGDGAGLRLAAPDAGDAGLTQAEVARLVGQPDQDVLADRVDAKRADDGEVAADLAVDRLGGDDCDWHGIILHAARSETSSNTWKLRVIREASLSLCLVDTPLSVSWIAAWKAANVAW